MTKKWLRLAAPAALLAFGATACGSGSGPQLDGWAKSLCEGVQSPVQQSNVALADTGALKPGETPQALQTRLAADLGALAAANTQIAQAVQKAGAPNVTNGAQTQADAVTELNQAAGGYTTVQHAVQALVVSDQAKFAASLKGVGDQVQRLAEQSTSALQTLQTGDLGTALAKQPGCKSVNGAGTATGSGSASPSASGPAAGVAPSASSSTSAGSSASGTASGAASGTGSKAASKSASASASAH